MLFHKGLLALIGFSAAFVIFSPAHAATTQNTLDKTVQMLARDCSKDPVAVATGAQQWLARRRAEPLVERSISVSRFVHLLSPLRQSIAECNEGALGALAVLLVQVDLQELLEWEQQGLLVDGRPAHGDAKLWASIHLFTIGLCGVCVVTNMPYGLQGVSAATAFVSFGVMVHKAKAHRQIKAKNEKFGQIVAEYSAGEELISGIEHVWRKFILSPAQAESHAGGGACKSALVSDLK